MNRPGLSDPTFRTALVAIVLLGASIRLALDAPGPGPPVDPDRYLVLARSLADGRGYTLDGRPTAYRPPLYPIVLAPLVACLGDRPAWGVAGLNVALGAGTVALSAVAARRWGLTRGRTLVASAVVACDPVLLAQGRMVMTEPLSAFLVAATLAALLGRGRAAPLLGGLGFGLASLCRPSLLPAAGLSTLAALALGPGGAWARLRLASGLALTTVAVLTPWALRNARVLGDPVWTTTHGGYTLALANNPVYYAEVLDGPPGAVWSGPNQRRWFEETRRLSRGMTESQADRRCYAEGLRTIVDRPRDFARASLARLGRFWGLAPAGAIYSRKLRLATLAWTVPLWIALALGLTSRETWAWPRVAAPAILAALTAIHSIYWTDMRMRAPAVPAIALIAAGARPWRRQGFASPGTCRIGAEAGGNCEIEKKFKIPTDSSCSNPGETLG